ncbi:MAG: EAL domain-containing protein [Solirubrobacteraceae bacterium]
MTEDVKGLSQTGFPVPVNNGFCSPSEAALERLPFGVLLIVDADLRVVVAEGRGLARHGIGMEGARGRLLHDVVDARLLEALLPEVQAALAGEEGTFELPDRDGVKSDELMFMPRRDSGGHADGALVFSYNAAAVSARATAAETRYRLLAESATDVVSLRDRGGRYQYMSPSATALSGRRPEEHIGRHILEFVHPDDRELVEGSHARLLAGEDVVEIEYRVICRDDSFVWVRTTARALHDPAGSTVTGVRASTQNISEQREREAELQATTAELKLRLRKTAAIAQLGERALEEADLGRFLADAASSVAEILDVPLCAVLTDGDDDGGLRVRACAGWRSGTLGRSIVNRAGVETWLRRLGRAPVVFTDLPPQASWRRLLREHCAVSGMWVVLADLRRPFGMLTVHSRVQRDFNDDDRMFLVAVANILRDAIARHRTEDAARHDALHDALTGLPNRRLLTDRLGHALVRSARSGERHAVMFLDVDRFKLVNDSLGHDAGDRLLCLLGPHLCAAVRPIDTVARFGGDEFVVLCEDVRDEQHAGRLAQRLTDAVRRCFDIDGRDHVASASVGVAVTNGAGCTPEEVLRDADTAMYRAKEGGRGRFEIFDVGMRRRTLARLELEDELRRALAHDDLLVHYQPIHAIDVEVPAMVEALVRWQHPRQGLLGPASFIAVAEETNLILPLGSRVLRQACAQVAVWRKNLPAARELALSVNVSARQIDQPSFVTEVDRVLSETGMPAHALHLEITEGVLLQDSSATAAAIARLRERGIRIVLDDFGTGYSSLSYLRRFALDVLKIDRSFVSDLDECIENRIIVATIITMAHALGFDVTAEGIETPEQLQALRELGCAYVQGYLLARPMPPEDIEALLSNLDAPLR